MIRRRRRRRRPPHHHRRPRVRRVPWPTRTCGTRVSSPAAVATAKTRATTRRANTRPRVRRATTTSGRTRIAAASRTGTMIGAGTRTRIEVGRVTIIAMIDASETMIEVVAAIGTEGMIGVVPVIGMVEGAGNGTDGGREAAEDTGKVTQEATRARWAATEVAVAVEGTVLPTINTTAMRRVRITATTAIRRQCRPMATQGPVLGHLLHRRRRNPNLRHPQRAANLSQVKPPSTTATCGTTENPPSHLRRNPRRRHRPSQPDPKMIQRWRPAMTTTADRHSIWTPG
uniref:(northern house mosquito) hypothetical protein n=2 Tax=Culex pipiens TaxID=7175 RepID=A0A8D8PEB2_CULPI